MTIFFYGSNTYELRKHLKDMTGAYISKAGSDFGLERVNGESVRAQELVAILGASPFLANSRLVIVEGMALNKTIATKLPAIMAGIPATTVAVFADREVDQRTTAFKQLIKADKVVKFDLLTGPKLLGWVKAEIEEIGGHAEPTVLRELVELAGEDQWRLVGEINKLVNFNSDITLKQVQAMVTPSIEQSIFELVEAMTAGKVDVALAGFHRLLELKENEVYILTMVQWQLRNLLLAKSAPAEMSPTELAKVAGMSPYVAGKMVGAQARIGMSSLISSYIATAECEYDIKTGRLKAEIAVEQLIFRISSGFKSGI